MADKGKVLTTRVSRVSMSVRENLEERQERRNHETQCPTYC